MIESWQPANHAEHAMLSALQDGDTGGYFAIVARIPLYLPAFTDVAVSGGDQRFVVWNLEGTQCLLAFTSVAAMRAVLGDRLRGGLTTNYTELAAKWPNPAWRLAIDPDLPIYAITGIEDVAAAANRRIVVPTAAQLLSDGGFLGDGDDPMPEPPDEFEPANPTETALWGAIARGDPDEVIGLLATAVLAVPTTVPVVGAFAAEQPDFPWYLGHDADGTPWIPAFTSVAALRTVLPADTPSVQMPASVLGRCWPARTASRLVVNPGSPIQIPLESEAVPGLTETAEDLLGTDLPAPADQGDDVPPPAGPASREPLPAGGELRGAARPAFVPTDATSGPAPVAAGPTLVQKVLPHPAVDVYLRHGFNRVSGLVYPASSLAGATTPARLYEALGLTAGETGYHPEDRDVHVIRWYARCPELYREALGAADEQVLATVGGFMVEPAPFLGAGVSPGSVPALELKADGLVLPHGAQLYRLTEAGEAPLAAYDADVRAWVPVSQQQSIADLMR